jgi:hypothetical protein
MTDIGDNAADAAVLSEKDASIMLLALTGRVARCGLSVEQLHVRKRVEEAEERLEVVNTELRLNLFKGIPRTGRK